MQAIQNPMVMSGCVFVHAGATEKGQRERCKGEQTEAFPLLTSPSHPLFSLSINFIFKATQC